MAKKEEATAETGGEDKPPPFGQQIPIEAAGNLPRIIRGENGQPPGNYRAPAGATRYKIRAKAHQDLGTLYVLAKKADEAGARKAFLKATGLDTVMAKAEQDSGKPVDPPELIVTELPD